MDGSHLFDVLNLTVGLAAIFVSIVSVWLQTPKKRISYEVIASVHLSEFKKNIKPEVLKLINENKKTLSFQSLLIKVFNSGNLVIKPNEFAEPLKLEFFGDSTIVSWEILAQNPENMKCEFNSDEKSLTCAPFLMNCGDYFILKILVLNYSGDFSWSARIEGMRRVEKYEGYTGKKEFMVNFFIIVFGVILYITRKQNLPWIPSFALFTFALYLWNQVLVIGRMFSRLKTTNEIKRKIGAAKK